MDQGALLMGFGLLVGGSLWMWVLYRPLHTVSVQTDWLSAYSQRLRRRSKRSPYASLRALEEREWDRTESDLNAMREFRYRWLRGGFLVLIGVIFLLHGLEVL